MLNCEAIQEQLLQCEDPARPPAGLLRHLNHCPACQRYRERLIELEDGLRQLSAPVSTRKDRLVARLQEGELPTPSPQEARPSPWRPSLKERTQQKIALALAMAALLALFTFGWGIWPHAVPSASEKRQEHKQLVQREKTPRQAIEKTISFVLALENDVLRAVQRQPDADIDELATFYVELVEVDLIDQARQLPAAERAQVVAALVERLQRSESSLSRASARLADAREDLARMSEAARTSQARLRALLA